MFDADVNRYIVLLSPYLPPTSLPMVRQQLEQSDMSDMAMSMVTAQMKEPSLVLVLSVFVGYFGVDRFYLGDIVLGILKLLTGGICGIWWLVDLFLIMNKTREVNLQHLLSILAANRTSRWG